MRYNLYATEEPCQRVYSERKGFGIFLSSSVFVRLHVSTQARFNKSPTHDSFPSLANDMPPPQFLRYTTCSFSHNYEAGKHDRAPLKQQSLNSSAPVTQVTVRTATVVRKSAASVGLQGYGRRKPPQLVPGTTAKKKLGGIPSLAIFFFAKMEWRGNSVYLHIVGGKDGRILSCTREGPSFFCDLYSFFMNNGAL